MAARTAELAFLVVQLVAAIRTPAPVFAGNCPGIPARLRQRTRFWILITAHKISFSLRAAGDQVPAGRKNAGGGTAPLAACAGMKKPTNWRQALLKFLLAGLIFYMLLRWFEHSQVYHPGRRMDADGIAAARPFEDVVFKTSDGIELNGWYFAARTNSPRSQIAVLLCHGNGGNISGRADLYHAWLQTGVAVFAFDYRGYGRSQGRPGEEGTYLDAQAACQWLARKGFTHIIAYGESLGGGIATELCLREKICGLILQSTFTSIPDIGVKFFPWLPVRWLATIQYDTHSKLPRLKIPVLVMHSRTDEVAAYEFAERNFAVANEPKLFWEIYGGHNDALEERDHFIAGVEKFLRLVETRPIEK